MSVPGSPTMPGDFQSTMTLRLQTERDWTNARLEELRQRLDDNHMVASGAVTRGDMQGLRLLVDERHESQLRAFDRAFAAQEKAVAAASASAERAVDKASASLHATMAAALQAQEKALGVAQVTMEKRLEGMNEFRAQLADQVATFIPRIESQQTVGSLSDKLSAETSWTLDRFNEIDKRIAGRLDGLTSRLDVIQGAQANVASTRSWQMAFVMILLVAISVGVAIFMAMGK